MLYQAERLTANRRETGVVHLHGHGVRNHVTRKDIAGFKTCAQERRDGILTLFKMQVAKTTRQRVVRYSTLTLPSDKTIKARNWQTVGRAKYAYGGRDVKSVVSLL